MKTVKFLSTAVLASALIFSCSSDEITASTDDDNTPDPVNEEEVITTVTVTLISADGSETVTLQSRDLDGDDGPNLPVVTDPVNLTAGTTYFGSIELLNETEDPAEDVTEEILEEDLDHQFFYEVESELDIVASYLTDVDPVEYPGAMDSEGDPLGQEFSLVTNGPSSGALQFVLLHEPEKPNDGDWSTNPGSVDINVTFNVVVQ